MPDDVLHIPRWMPSSAAERAVSLWPDLNREDDRRLLRRLVDDLVMKTDVWPELPSTAEGFEGEVLDAAFNYGRKEFGDYVLGPDPLPYVPVKVPWREGPPLALRFHQIAERAATLRDAIVESGSAMAPTWTEKGVDDSIVEFAKVVAMLDDVQERYAARQRKLEASFSKLPRIRKRGSPKARQWLFIPVMASHLHWLHRRPPNARLVAALTQVVFDLDEGVAVEAVRSRLRAYRKTHFNMP